MIHFFYSMAASLWSVTGWISVAIIVLFVVGCIAWAAYWEWRELRDMANEEHRKHKDKHGL